MENRKDVLNKYIKTKIIYDFICKLTAINRRSAY